MSAKKDEYMGHAFFFHNDMSKEEEAFLFLMFDESVDFDLTAIERTMKETKAFRKIALCKTLVYPLEYLVSYLGGKGYKQHVVKQQSLFWKILTKKIDVDEFKIQTLRLSGEKDE